MAKDSTAPAQVCAGCAIGDSGKGGASSAPSPELFIGDTPVSDAGIDAVLTRLRQAADDPVAEAKAAKEAGKKVVGVVPYFFPLELVHAAGMHPVEIWGGGQVTAASSRYYPAFYCSVLFTLMDRALDGTYDDLDAVIIPTTCDGLRNLEENWKFARPDMTVIDYVQPVVRTGHLAHDYNKGQLKRIAGKLEEVTGEKIGERALRESINAYNRQRQALRRFSELAAQSTKTITPLVRQGVFAAARGLSVEEHTALVERLNTLLEANSEERDPDRIAVVLTGVIVDSPSLLAELEKNNIDVVGDHTTSESARYFFDVPARIDPFDSLAELWECVRGSSIALDAKKERGDILVDLAHERGADGVVAFIVKFCEAEEFDVPVLLKQMEAAGLPFLSVEVESQNVASEQAATRIQAFSELIDAQR